MNDDILTFEFFVLSFITQDIKSFSTQKFNTINL